MTRPATYTPENDKKTENESYPEQKAFRRVLKAVYHRADQHQRNGIAGREVYDVHRRRRIQRRISYAAQNVMAIRNPLSIVFNLSISQVFQ